MATQGQPQPPRGSMEDEDIVLELSRFCCAGFLIATNMLYSYLGDVKLIYYNKLLDSSLAGQLSNLGWLFSVVGSVHALEMLKMIVFSIHACELSLRFQSRKQKVTPALPPSMVAVRVTAGAASGDTTAQPAAQKDLKAPALDESHAKTTIHIYRVAARVMAPLAFVFHKLTSLVPNRVKVASKRLVRAPLRLRRALYDKRHGYMSVQSKYFHYLFLIRETIEIASQSYQMYNSSTLLARPWINAFFLALVVVNCWSTPILQHALAHSSGLERVICLVLDGLLDAGSAIYIPLIVSIPYAQVFDTELLAFPSDYLYDPQWFVNMVRENRMLFAMSGKDLFSKLVPHHSLYICMKNVKKFIVRKHNTPVAAGTAQQRHEPGAKNDKENASVASKRGSSFMSSFCLKRENIEHPGRGKQLVHFVFTSWGIAVLAIYLHARHVSVSNDVSACKFELRPWFVTSFACASYNFDCYEQGQVDTLTSSDLSMLYVDSLAALIISNCPAVEMPSELQNFPNLLKFLLYNSTISSWDASASLNVYNHTALVSIILVRVNMTEFPLGLQQQLPDAMLDFQVSTSNLTSLPSALAQSWHPMTILYFEHCEFTEFPLVLLEIRADDVSLAGAKIASLPSNMSSASFAWVNLLLAGNALLTELPATAMKAGLLSLSIENTAVSEIPSWIYSDMATGAGTLEVYAYNTPYCIAQSLAAASSSSSLSSSGSSATSTGSTSTSIPPAAASGIATVNCETRDPSGEEGYPLALTTAAFQPVVLEEADAETIHYAQASPFETNKQGLAVSLASLTSVRNVDNLQVLLCVLAEVANKGSIFSCFAAVVLTWQTATLVLVCHSSTGKRAERFALRNQQHQKKESCDAVPSIRSFWTANPLTPVSRPPAHSSAACQTARRGPQRGAPSIHLTSNENHPLVHLHSTYNQRIQNEEEQTACRLQGPAPRSALPGEFVERARAIGPASSDAASASPPATAICLSLGPTVARVTTKNRALYHLQFDATHALTLCQQISRASSENKRR